MQSWEKAMKCEVYILDFPETVLDTYKLSWEYCEEKSEETKLSIMDILDADFSLFSRQYTKCATFY